MSFQREAFQGSTRPDVKIRISLSVFCDISVGVRRYH
jgi:hypothetical protein